MCHTMRAALAGGQPSGLRDIARNDAQLDPDRYTRLADFMADTTSMKAYLREHCKDVVIDLTEYPWSAHWVDRYLYLPDDENIDPKRANVCVNVTYMEEFDACATLAMCMCTLSTCVTCPCVKVSQSSNISCKLVCCLSCSSCGPGEHCVDTVCPCRRWTSELAGGDPSNLSGAVRTGQECFFSIFEQDQASTCYSNHTMNHAPTRESCDGLRSKPYFAKPAAVRGLVAISEQLHKQCIVIKSKVCSLACFSCCVCDTCVSIPERRITATKSAPH